MQRPTTLTLLCSALLGCGATPPALADGDITVTDPNNVQVALPSATVHELSGITFLGGDQYLLVSDSGGILARATINIDLATGEIAGTPTLDSSIDLFPVGSADLEGVAYDPRDATVLVSNEDDHAITRFDPDTAALLGSVTVPAVYQNAASNRSLESLSLDTVNFNLWTANEEALTVDGPLATPEHGTVVRLQHFDAQGQPVGQFAYLTEPHRPASTDLARSGVADLVALPNGQVIVLERELGGEPIPTLRNRLYLVDTTTATDTSEIDALIGEDVTLAEKTLLFEYNAGLGNYEGIALGPRLDNGDYALVLVTDDSGGGLFKPQNLTALRLSGIALPGDLDGDWHVGSADLDILLAHWGQNVDAGVLLQGDTDGNGTVDQADLDAVLDHWGDGEPPEVVVPEPAGMLGLGAGAFAAFKRVR